MLEADVTDALDTGQQRVQFLGSGGHDGPELMPVDRLGDFAAGVADEPGDLLDDDIAVRHQADEGVPQLPRQPEGPPRSPSSRSPHSPSTAR